MTGPISLRGPNKLDGKDLIRSLGIKSGTDRGVVEAKPPARSPLISPGSVRENALVQVDTKYSYGKHSVVGLTKIVMM